MARKSIEAQSTPERPYIALVMGPTTARLVSLDGATGLLLSLHSAADSDRFTRYSLWSQAIRLQGFSKTPTKQPSQPVNDIHISEGWIMDNTVPVGWVNRLFTKLPSQLMVPDQQSHTYSRNAQASPPIVSSVPLIDVLSTTDASLINIFGQAPQTRFSIYQAYFYLKDAFGITKIPTKLLGEYAGLSDKVIAQHMNELNGNIFTYTSTNREEYRQYRFTQNQPPTLVTTYRGGLSPARLALQQELYALFVAERANGNAMTFSTIINSLPWNVLPPEIQELQQKDREHEVREIIRAWNSHGSFEKPNEEFSFAERAYTSVNGEWEPLLRFVVNTVSWMSYVEAGNYRLTDEDITRFDRRANELVSQPLVMKRMFGKQRRDSRTGSQLSNPRITADTTALMKEYDHMLSQKVPFPVQIDHIDPDQDITESSNTSVKKAPTVRRDRQSTKNGEFAQANGTATTQDDSSHRRVIISPPQETTELTQAEFDKEQVILLLLKQEQMGSTVGEIPRNQTAIPEQISPLLLHSGRGVIEVTEKESWLYEKRKTINKVTICSPGKLHIFGTPQGDQEIYKILQRISPDMQMFIFDPRLPLPIRYYRYNHTGYYFINPLRNKMLRLENTDGKLTSNAGPLHSRLLQAVSVFLQEGSAESNQNLAEQFLIAQM